MYCTGQASYGKTPGAVSVRGVVTGVKGRLQCPLDPCHCLQPYGGATVWEKYRKNNRVSTWGVWCRCWRIFFFFVSVWFGYSFAPRPEPTTGMCSGGSKDPSSKLLPSTGRRTGRWPDARVCCSRSHCRDTQGQMKKTTDSCGVTAKTRSESGGGMRRGVSRCDELRLWRRERVVHRQPVLALGQQPLHVELQLWTGSRLQVPQAGRVLRIGAK